MRMKTLVPLAVLMFCYAIFFACITGSYELLPARVASHFDAYGHPNGWMSRENCVAGSLALGILLPALIVTVIFLSRFLPASLVNLPNKAYWLAPEQRKETNAALLRFALWFASLAVLFAAGMHSLVVLANFPGHSPHLSTAGITLVAGCFLVGMAAWIVALFGYFARKV